MRKARFDLSILAAGGLALLVLAPATASAQMTFQLDPIVLQVLEKDIDTSSSKFEEYEDLSTGFNIPWLRLVGADAENDRFVEFRATNVERRDARYTVQYGEWGRQRLELDYNKIVHRLGNDATLLWNRTGPGTWELPDPTQAFIQDALERQRAISPPSVNAAFLRGVLQPFVDAAGSIDLAVQRDRTEARFSLGGLAGLAWSARYQHENRLGLRPFGASFGFNNATEVPEPIDYTTSTAELKGEWNGTAGGVQVGARHSTFENSISTLFWDNPYRLTDATEGGAFQAPGAGSIAGAARGFADLAPDNQATTLFANGRTRFAGTWFAQGGLGYTRMTQDEPLLPFTLNTAIVGIGFDGQPFDPTDPANLPARRADQEVDVLNLTADVGTRFAEDFSLTFRYRLYDYDNGSRRLEFPGYVRFHGQWQATPRVTVPYSYRRQTAGVELGWDITDRQGLEVYYELRSWDRDFRETESSDEDVIGAAWDARLSDRLSLRARYEVGDRSIDGQYRIDAAGATFVDPHASDNQPGLRKFLQADRKSQEMRLQADYLATDNLQVSFGLSGREDDYDESELGLLLDESLVLSFDASYAPGAGFTINLFGSREDRQVDQASRQSGATPSVNPNDTWRASFDEVVDTWGLGLVRTAGAWTWDLTARWSRADGDADLSTPPGGNPSIAIGFDDYDDAELLALLLGTEYSISDNLTAGFTYRFEDYDTRRFRFDGLEPLMPGAILLVPQDGSYTAHLFGVHVKLRL